MSGLDPKRPDLLAQVCGEHIEALEARLPYCQPGESRWLVEQELASVRDLLATEGAGSDA